LNGSALCDRLAHLNGADPSSVENGPGPIRPNADRARTQNHRSPLRQTVGTHSLPPPTFSPTCAAKGLPYLCTALACRALHGTPLSCCEAATPRSAPAQCSTECVTLSIPHRRLRPGFPTACLLTGTHRVIPPTVTMPTVRPCPLSHPMYATWLMPTVPPVPSAPIISYRAAHRFPAGAHRLSPPHACATFLILFESEKGRPTPVPCSNHHYAPPSPCVCLSSYHAFAPCCLLVLS
jgi:hypothetical protein